MSGRTKTRFNRLIAAACAAAGYGRGYQKDVTLWTARATWDDPECPGDDVVNAGADDLDADRDYAYARWDGTQVIEVYVFQRYGPVGYQDVELVDNVEIDPVAMEWSATGRPWTPLALEDRS